MTLNRRDFGKLALAAAVAPAGRLRAERPDSVYGGVRIGVITYSFRDMPEAHTSATAMLKYVTESGASGIELMADVAEAYAGATGPAKGPERSAWREQASMDKFKDFRKMYNDAGVSIYAFKAEPMTAATSDRELDYIFGTGKILGATHCTLELPASNPANDAFTQRLGDFALKHGMLAAYHAHEQATITAWDKVLAQSKGNAANVDLGHYFAGTGQDPVPAMEKLHSRIASVHLKDRKASSKPGGRDGANLPWGQGDTPLVEILQTIRKNKYPFPASVELEYAIPPGSDSVVEVKKCIEYARKALA